MAYIGPNSPSTAADDSSLSGDTWSNPNNAKVADASYATSTDTNPNHTHYLKTTNYGFSIPAGSDIQGIVVEVLRHASSSGVNNVTDYAVKIVKSDGSIGVANKADTVSLWPTSDAYAAYGGAADLWGESWSVADINSSNFGVAFSANLTPDTSVTAFVDFIRVTVYYSIGADPTNLNMQKRHIYKVYNSAGTFLGRLPRPTSDFAFSQDINSGGSQITVQVPVSADTSALPSNDAILDETGANIFDENSNDILNDGGNTILGVGNGPDELIKNGNEVIVVEYGYYHPNGIVMFRGVIKHWEATFGGDGQDDSITLLIYSDGQDLQSHLIRGYGALAADQSQTAQDTDIANNSSNWFYGQTFVAGSSVTHIGAISIYVGAFNSLPTTVTMHLTTAPGNADLGSTTMVVTNTTAGPMQFIFSSPIAVTPGASYFFYFSTTGGTFNFNFQSTDVYGSGQFYFSSNSGSSWTGQPTEDLYFVIYSSLLSTIANNTNKDPTTGILEPFMDAYTSEGGKVTYNDSSVTATGLSISYDFNTNTVYEGIQAMLSVSPNGFYFYVDLGSNILYFKQASTTADIVLTKGKHLNQIKIVASIEYIVNEVYFTGGVIPSGPGAGTNYYTLDQDSTSITEYGVALDRQQDNRVTDITTAHAIGSSEVAAKKDEQYMTTVTVVEKTIDTTLFKPGLIIGFNGFGSFMDNLLAQIVHIDCAPEQVSLQLGLLPKRLINSVEQTTKGLVALSTVGNPTNPS
jgi:hypothetical protein